MRKSGTTITTGGITISAVITDSSHPLPRKRIRANAKAASADTVVESRTAPTARTALLPNHTKNCPSRSAVTKLPKYNDRGGPILLKE
jgi:hypothetical protein